MKIISMLLLATATMFMSGCSSHYEKVKILDKTVKNYYSDKSAKSIYLIDTDKGVFENTDTLLKMKFNSSDLYFDLKIGHCYKIEYYWFRNYVLSQYQNIVAASETPCLN